MHDTLDYMARDPVHRRYHHDELTFGLLYAFTENFVLPLQPRRGGARQGLAARQDARRPLAAVRQPARLLRLHVGPSRQEAAVHGRRVRPGARVEPRRTRSTGTCSPIRCTAACRGWCATSTALYRALPALHELRLRARPASSGSTSTTPSSSVLAFLRAARDGDRRCWSSATSRRSSRQRLPARRAARRPLAREHQHRCRRLRRLRRRQWRRRRRGRAVRGTAARTRSTLTLPPLATV